MAEYQPHIFLIVGLIVLIYPFLTNSKKNQLKQTGIPVDGIIFEQGFENSRSSTNRYSFAKDKITVRFVTQDNEWVTGVINKDFRIFYTKQYKDGETIKVYYDEQNPSNFYVDTKQSELAGRLLFAVIGLMIVLIGLYQLFVL